MSYLEAARVRLTAIELGSEINNPGFNGDLSRSGWRTAAGGGRSLQSKGPRRASHRRRVMDLLGGEITKHRPCTRVGGC
jgi:hypothetical protein